MPTASRSFNYFEMDGSESGDRNTGQSESLPFSFEETTTLTRALKRGDDSAFSWLYHQWSNRINRYCFALAAGDEASASEVAQNVWLRLARHIRPLESEAALWNWIAQAARHAAVDLHRGRGSYRRLLGRFFDLEKFSQCSGRNSTQSSLPEDELLEALETALQKLDAADRALIEDRYFHGISLREMGRNRNLSERAVEGRLARLRKRLKKQIAQELRSQEKLK